MSMQPLDLGDTQSKLPGGSGPGDGWSAWIATRRRWKSRASGWRSSEDKVTLVHANFSQIGEVFAERSLPPADGVLADLGVSSMQLDLGERGFSFRARGPLDMRMDRETEETASDIVNTADEKALADLLYQYGEERDSRRIARTIVRARPIRDTEHLATVVAGARNVKGKAEAASRDKNVSGAADCGESRDGGTRAVSF